MEYVRFFENSGFLVDAVPDGSDIVPLVSDKKPDIVIADLSTPGFSASGFLEKVDSAGFSCQTILLSSEPVVEHAVHLMRLGALDYLIKPVTLTQVELCVKRGLELLKNKALPDSAPLSHGRKKVKIITRDRGVMRLLDLASRVADSSASVLIQGESGTGKELFARFIHEKSNRQQMPFIPVNCASLPENLLESELFGHEKGAFTGAIARKTGKFELAHNGTLFLDEITEMQVHLQAKLLRALQERVIDRVGGTVPVDVNVRVIATTNRDAKKAVEEGEFREDLFYRLNTIPLIIPPLRDRKGDIEVLCDFFVRKYCKIDDRNVKGLTNQASDMLKRHNFPGNVRELENIIHRAVLLADGDMIKPEDLMLEISGTESCPPEHSRDHDIIETDSGSLKEMEQKMIFKTLDRTDGNRTHAARILGISVRTLRNKLNEYKESR
jgi:two-component system response regulator FlrC